MFWTNFRLLCMQIGKSPSAVAKEIGMKSTGTVSAWKKGTVPEMPTLEKIADYFGITVADLLGEKNPATGSDGNDSISAEKHAYVNSLFDQLSFEKQIQAIDYLKQLLQRQ